MSYQPPPSSTLDNKCEEEWKVPTEATDAEAQRKVQREPRIGDRNYFCSCKNEQVFLNNCACMIFSIFSIFFVPIMSSILQNGVKYHEETADFKNRDCLVAKIHKSTGMIMKSPDLTGYFNLAM